MSPRRFTIIIIVFLVVIAIGGYVLYVRNMNTLTVVAPAVTQKQDNSGNNTPLPSVPNRIAPPTQSVFPDDSTLKNTPSPVIVSSVIHSSADEEFEAFARSFAERFGTYSNQSHFTNLRHVLTMTTAPLNARLEDIISSGNTTSNQESYRGVSTIALSINTIERDGDGSITRAAILTQRRYEEEQKQLRIVTETLIVNVMTNNGMWFISDAQWKQ